jgi:hypothetical protein
MIVEYEGEIYHSIKEAYEDFLCDINFDDVEFKTEREAYNYFVLTEIKKVNK